MQLISDTACREMIKNSRKWAMARNLLRKNEVHGAEEWRIPTKASFQHTATTGQSSTFKGSMALEEIIWVYSDLHTASGGILDTHEKIVGPYWRSFAVVGG